MIFFLHDAEAKTKMKEIMEQINIDMGINYLDKKFHPVGYKHLKVITVLGLSSMNGDRL